MQSGEKSDLRTVSRKWGGVSEGAAGKHSGFQNNPGFEMLEMLDSGPFLKLGVGVGDTDQFGATRTRRRNGPDRGSGTASGEGDPEKKTKSGSQLAYNQEGRALPAGHRAKERPPVALPLTEVQRQREPLLPFKTES